MMPLSTCAAVQIRKFDLTTASRLPVQKAHWSYPARGALFAPNAPQGPHTRRAVAPGLPVCASTDPCCTCHHHASSMASTSLGIDSFCFPP